MSARRYFALSADLRVAAGYDLPDAAEACALGFGEGAFVVDTKAAAYHPLLQQVAEGALTLLPIGAWDIRGTLERNLIEAVKRGSAPLVKAFLAKGASAQATDGNGGSALHWAVARDSSEIARMLLDSGADPAARDANGLTALDLARRTGRDAVAEHLATIPPPAS